MYIHCCLLCGHNCFNRISVCTEILWTKNRKHHNDLVSIVKKNCYYFALKILVSKEKPHISHTTTLEQSKNH